MRSTKPGCFRSCPWCLWKALDEEWCMGLVPQHLEYWMISSLKIKLNHSWILEELERAFGVVRKILIAGFNGINLLTFGFRMSKILILVISATENSNKFQKSRFWKEKSVENVSYHSIQAWFPFTFGCSKKSISTLQNNVHM